MAEKKSAVRRGKRGRPRPARASDLYAAVDLGTNNCRLLVATPHGKTFRVVDSPSQIARLGEGLHETGRLSGASIERAMDALNAIRGKLKTHGVGKVRCIATEACRKAENGPDFIQRVHDETGLTFKIIGAKEEARLASIGCHDLIGDDAPSVLVVDIGGGSTEFIIGEAFEPKALESLRMGCVTFTGRFFADGELTEKRMRRAELAALSELANIQRPYQRLGWDDPVGSSGTIKAAASVLHAYGDTPQEGVITRSGLKKLRERLLKCKHLEKVELDGLKPDRARVFPAGIAILSAIFEAFDLHQMRFADGALREGVLYDMAGRNSAEDTRSKTLDMLKRVYDVDTRQAENVAETAKHLFAVAKQPWGLTAEQGHYLSWASHVHEIGLAISHSQFHRHGAYLLEHSDLAGFSRPEQRLLAFLVRAHRRKFPLKEWQALPASQQPSAAKLARLLRLAVLINHSRPEGAPMPPKIAADSNGDALTITLPPSDEPTLLSTDLEQEQTFMANAGFSFNLNTPS